MSAKSIKGITVEIGGNTIGLVKVLKEANRPTNELESNLKKVNKALEMDPSSVELAAEKQKVLASYVDATREKLQTLESVQEQIAAQYASGEIGQSAYLDFQKELVYTRTKLEDLEKQQKEFGDTVEAVANGELENFNATLKETDNAAEEAGDGFTVAKGAIADFVSDAVQSAIGWIKEMVGELLNLADATEEFQTMQAKLAGSADTFGYSMQFASGEYQNFYKYLSDDQAATNAITNLMGLRVSTETLTKLTNGAIAVWTAYGDSIPIESLTESINESAQVAQVTGVLADALNWAGISEDAFNQQLAACNSTQERANLIASTLNDTYGVSKDRYDQLNGSILANNEAEQKLAATEAQLGEAMRPVNTSLTELKNEILIALLPLITSLANGFVELLGWLQEHPAVLQLITGAVIGLALAFGVLAAAMAIQGIISMLTGGFVGLGSAMSLLPVVGIVTGIGVIVGSLIYLGTHLQELRALWTEGCQSITNDWKTGYQEMALSQHDSLAAQASEVRSFSSSIAADWRAGQQAMVSAQHSAHNAQVASWQSFCSRVMSTFQSWSANLRSSATSAMENVRSAISSGLERVKSLFRFEWSLPHIRLPHFSISGRFSLDPPSVPHFGVQWYAKGAILNGAQLFGMLGGNFLGGGEAGPEAVLPLSGFYDNLNHILTSFLHANASGSGGSGELISRLDRIYDRLNHLQVVMDSGALVGEILDPIDEGLADKQLLAARGG